MRRAVAALLLAGLTIARAAALVETVGPIGVDGFPEPGIPSRQTAEYGTLDGLVAVAPDGTALLVTTAPILHDWLAHNLEGKSPADAFASRLFYQSLAPGDRIAFRTTDLPVTARPGDVAAAILLHLTDDLTGVGPPDTLAVSIATADRIYLFQQPVTVAPFPDCAPRFTDVQAALDRFNAAANDRRSDSALIKVTYDAWKATAERARLCVAGEFERRPAASDLARRAQALADKVSPR